MLSYAAIGRPILHNSVVMGILFAGFFGGLAVFLTSCGFLWGGGSLSARTRE